MRLTTKFSAFVTLLTGLTIFVTLLGCSLSFYNAIQYKFSPDESPNDFYQNH